jgi:DNA polymerase
MKAKAESKEQPKPAPFKYVSNSKQRRFKKLSREAAHCRLCPKMADQPAVLGPTNGPLHAQILIVAEAPGRLGAGRTGIPFSGDRSGENFETLLARCGLTRSDVFITNAALCNPLHNGNNRRPSTSEIHNCSGFLKSILDIIEPRVVVTLGTVGLQAVNHLLGTDFQLKQEVARLKSTPDFMLLPLYHPSPRVTNWKRPLEQQVKDFKKVILALQTPPC